MTDDGLEIPGSPAVPCGDEASFGGGTVSAQSFGEWQGDACVAVGDDAW